MTVPTIIHDLRDTLTDKERSIYGLLCQNLNNAEIAHALSIPKATIEWNLRNIYRKLGVDMKSSEGNGQQARRRAILYSGTRIEQVVSYGSSGEKTYSIREIRTAAKKTGCSSAQIENLISFLEMES